MIELSQMADALTASGKYRVLRRLAERPTILVPDGTDARLALFVDVETTGLDPARDEIIELAMVPFVYGPDGTVYEVREPYQSFNEPRQPISPEITALTGITNEMVAGHMIDPVAVAEFVEPAVLVIAHNAGFDRLFLERLSPVFGATKAWGCSMSQVDWAAEGHEGTKLGYLAMGAGFFYDRHRASTDCLAGIEVLATTLPRAGVPAMAKLLETARRPTFRIWAENSPFDLKDALKARGYRWNGDGTPRAWFIDAGDEAARDREVAFLKADIYQRDVDLLIRSINAFDRFSERVS